MRPTFPTPEGYYIKYIDICEDMINISDIPPLRYHLADAYKVYAENLHTRGENKGAIRYFEKALELYDSINEEMPDYRSLWDGYIVCKKLAAAKLSFKKEDDEELLLKGIGYIERAIEKAAIPGFEMNYIDAYSAVAGYYRRKENAEKAEEYYLKAIAVGERLDVDYSTHLAAGMYLKALVYLGRIEFILGKCEQERKYLRRALDIFSAIKLPQIKKDYLDFIAVAVNLLSKVYESDQDYPNVIYCYRTGIEAALLGLTDSSPEDKWVDVALFYVNTARVYLYFIKDNALAVEWYEKTISLARERLERTPGYKDMLFILATALCKITIADESRTEGLREAQEIIKGLLEESPDSKNYNSVFKEIEKRLAHFGME